MPKSRESLSALTNLKSLSAEADLLGDGLPNVSDMEPFFDFIKETVTKIQACTTLKQLKEIKLPLDINHYLNKGKSEEKIKTIQTPKTQKEHVHSEKITTSVYKIAEKDLQNGREEKIATSNCKSSKKDKTLETYLPTSEEKSNPVASSTKSNKHTPKFPKSSYNVETPTLFKTPCAAQQTIEIPAPVLNRTITKGSNQMPLNRIAPHVAEETERITRSGSRKKAQEGSSETACLKEISSGLKQRLQGDENKDSSSQVRSGSKRKSASSSEAQKNKKPKKEVKNKSQTSQSKSNVKSNILRPANGSTQNSKVSAVIMPSLKQSIPSDMKEKKLEEIQKKEEKANENRKKVLAERQLKAEEQKKKREEKMEKALQKRILLDKEKDLDKSMDIKKSQAKVLVESVKKPILKQKNNELQQEQQVPEVCPPQSQKEITVQAVNKTPKKTHDSETYDLTPAPDSSTYDFSDEEENEPKGKPIPSWASGVLLKSALIQQFYYPLDTKEIFGTYIEAPNLAELFGVKKNYYFKRTSSAVWTTTPN